MVNNSLILILQQNKTMKRAWQNLAHKEMFISELHLLPLKTNNYKQMKKSYIFYVALIIIISHTSCRNVKEITMFQESKDDLTQYHMVPETSEHVIKPSDNLYINITTLDPEVNQQFNPGTTGGSGSTSGTSNMFGTPVAKYINGYIISDSGTVNLPIIGEVTLAGLNLEDAEARVKIKANEYLKDPTIQVKFLNYKINIIGEVKVPGIYYNYEGSISIFDAISMARGIADYADLENVTIKRYSGDMIYAHKVNLTDNSIYSTKFYYLQPNDVIYIPPSRLKRRRENATTYSQLLSTVSIIVFGFLGLYGIFK